MGSERIRIKDIAKMADVSVGTVDRVIHGRSGVSEASRKRVEEILKQLDYQPNMYASALASNKKYTFLSPNCPIKYSLSYSYNYYKL